MDICQASLFSRRAKGSAADESVKNGCSAVHLFISLCVCTSVSRDLHVISLEMNTLCRRSATFFFPGRRKPRLLRLCLGSLSSERPLTVLGIESSCDDTGVGVVTSRGAVLGNALHSQLSVHLK